MHLQNVPYHRYVVKVYKMQLPQVVLLANPVTGLLVEAQCLFILKLLYPGNKKKTISNYTYIVIIKHFEVCKSEPLSIAIYQ